MFYTKLWIPAQPCINPLSHPTPPFTDCTASATLAFLLSLTCASFLLWQPLYLLSTQPISVLPRTFVWLTPHHVTLSIGYLLKEAFPDLPAKVFSTFSPTSCKHTIQVYSVHSTYHHPK